MCTLETLGDCAVGHSDDQCGRLCSGWEQRQVQGQAGGAEVHTLFWSLGSFGEP